MKKEDKNIIIDKDNYKGYVELFEAQNYMSTYLKMFKERILSVVLNALGLEFLVMSAIIFYPTIAFIPVLKIIGEIILLVSGTYIVGTSVDCILKGATIKKEIYSAIKEKYSYVDTKASKKTLINSLADVGIIKRERDFGVCFVTLDVKQYENYLKAEEIKENYFEETKYDKYVVSPRIEEEELEKVKVKVKSLTR